VIELCFDLQCLQYVDASTLGELIPKVLELMRNSVGLGTRVACAHLIVLLTYHLKQELQPYTGMLILLHTIHRVQQLYLILTLGGFYVYVVSWENVFGIVTVPWAGQSGV
jgi:hypothetical protein